MNPREPLVPGRGRGEFPRCSSCPGGLAEEAHTATVEFPAGDALLPQLGAAPEAAREGSSVAFPSLHSLISTAKHPCPPLKASHTDTGIWFRWLNKKMSKSLPGFLHANQLSKI